MVTPRAYAGSPDSHFVMSSSYVSLPSAASSMIAVAVSCFVSDASRKFVAGVTQTARSTSDSP